MTILRHALVMTQDKEDHLYLDGFCAFDASGIVAVGDEKDLPQEYQGKGENLHGTLVMPGMCNTHTHMGMVSFRSLADDCPDRLRRFLLPLEDLAMDEKLVVASSKIAMAEMLLSGITSAVDMYYFEESVARAAVALGFRLWAGETIMDKAHCDAGSAKEGLALTKHLIAYCKGTNLVRPIVAPHAPYSVSAESLEACVDLARREDLLWTMHLSEMPFEMEQFKPSPVQYLEKLHLVDDRLLAVHLLHVDEADIALLGSRGVSVAHCPGSNAKAAKGVSPASDLQAAGCILTLGSDGPASGNTLDLFTQMKLYALLQKNRLHDRSAIPARTVVPLATKNAGEALHAPIGRLEVGYQADITVLSLERPNMVPCNDPYSVVVYSAQSQNVKDVYVGGRKLVTDGKLTTQSLSDLTAEFNEASVKFHEEAEKRA